MKVLLWLGNTAKHICQSVADWWRWFWWGY